MKLARSWYHFQKQWATRFFSTISPSFKPKLTIISCYICSVNISYMQWKSYAKSIQMSTYYIKPTVQLLIWERLPLCCHTLWTVTLTRTRKSIWDKMPYQLWRLNTSSFYSLLSFWNLSRKSQGFPAPTLLTRTTRFSLPSQSRHCYAFVSNV